MKKLNQQIERRDFLKMTGMGAAGLALGSYSGISTAGAAAPGGETLVYIFLRGGMDALSMLPPTHAGLRDVYRANRRDIAFDAHVLRGPGGGTYAFGINQRLDDLKRLWDDGDVSMILGAGSLTNTTSHFDQMAYIEGGSHRKRLAEGFFQRLKAQAGWSSSMALTAVEPILPRSMMGSRFALQYATSGELAGLPSSQATPGLSRVERLSRNYTGISQVNRTARDLASVSEGLSARLTGVAAPSAEEMPLEPLREITRLLSQSGERPRVISTSLGGWDFHSNLSSRFVETAAESGAPALSRSLRSMARILKNVGGRNVWSQTTIIVMSEFGRRIVENGADGADHGRGGAMLVLGGSIRGGRMVYSPGYVSRLMSLYADPRRDQAQLPVDFDYRLVLAEAIEKRFGLSNSRIFGHENSVFPENIHGTASQLNLEAGDSLASALDPAYNGALARASLRTIFG